jgi:hypothetical protein
MPGSTSDFGLSLPPQPATSCRASWCVRCGRALGKSHRAGAAWTVGAFVGLSRLDRSSRTGCGWATGATSGSALPALTCGESRRRGGVARVGLPPRNTGLFTFFPWHHGRAVGTPGVYIGKTIPGTDEVFGSSEGRTGTTVSAMPSPAA